MAQRSTGFWGHGGFTAVAASAVALLGGCSSRDVWQERDAGFAVEGSDVDWAVHESELGMREGHPYSRATYYRARPTLGVCEAGQCGAYRVHALPRRPLRCANGSVATECAVELIRSPVASPGGEEYVVRGRLLSETNAYNQTRGVIDADVVWSTMFYDPEDSEGVAYYSVSKPQRRCLREPCPAARVRRVGVSHARPVFEIDWQTAECPEVRAAEAFEQLELGELIVAGKLEHKRPFTAERLVVFQVLVTELPTYCAPPDAGPPPPRTCLSDPDCEYEGWCRETQGGNRECVPFKSNGQQCFWSPDEPWREERCQIGEQWCEPFSTPDAPGICRAACKGMCPMNEYCTPYGCNGTGTCLSDTDCMREDNPWTHAECTGYPTCEKDDETFGQCTWHCGEPACMDLSNRDLGTCEEFMGYGVYGSECRMLTGCEGAPVYDVPSFSTLEECQATCNVQMP